MDLLTDRGIFAERNEVKEGRCELEIFFGVKIVNGGVCDGKGNAAGGGRGNHGIRGIRGIRGKRELDKVKFGGTA